MNRLPLVESVLEEVSAAALELALYQESRVLLERQSNSRRFSPCSAR